MKRGGVLFTSQKDIMPELVRFTTKIHILTQRPHAVLLELHADPSTILSNPCAIGSIILKIVAIENAIFNGQRRSKSLKVKYINIKIFVNDP